MTTIVGEGQYRRYHARLLLMACRHCWKQVVQDCR